MTAYDMDAMQRRAIALLEEVGRCRYQEMPPEYLPALMALRESDSVEWDLDDTVDPWVIRWALNP